MLQQAEPQHVIETVEEILDTVDHAGTHPLKVSIGEIVDEIDGDAFPALMLLPALVMVSPLSGIPGLSMTMGAIIALAAVQMIAGRKSFWLPQWLRRITVTRAQLDKTVGHLSFIGRFLDSISSKRLSLLTTRPFSHIAATICLMIAMTTPILEFVPFSASTAGAAIAILSLALVTGDGLMMLAALTVTLGGGAAIWSMAAS